MDNPLNTEPNGDETMCDSKMPPVYVDGATGEPVRQPFRAVPETSWPLWRFYVGLPKGLTMIQDGRWAVLTAMREVFPSSLPAFTLVPTRGTWTTPQGRTLDESSFIVEIVDEHRKMDAQSATEIARVIGRELEQEAVLYTVETIRGAMVWMEGV